ncbi:MAG TPA: hypothetical protein PKY53_04810 [Clostridia bacterium]|nr:hypothetical protein [Clostridia bacterium]
MSVGSIILIVLGVMALIGLGSSAIRDFDVPVLGLVLALGAIVGLNFIAPLVVGNFIFSLGSALLFVMTFFLWLFKGKWSTKLMCLLIIAVLSGLTFGATRLSLYFGNQLWGRVNYFYALIIGFLAFIATRNAKYGFIAGILSVMAATLLTQIGRTVDLNEAYSTAIVAGTFAVVLYSFATRLMPSRPSRLAYYFEVGRMKD